MTTINFTIPLADNTNAGLVSAAEKAEIAASVTHAANTSNPHSTTKAQVGLSNVDNTADASKPVSTAQAAADAAVQAYVIQRGNHTGTQLAATISDFASAAVAAAPAETAATIAALQHAAASKATPVDTDELQLLDSASSYVLKKLTWANAKATLKTYFDTLYVVPATTLAGYGITDAVSSTTTHSANTVFAGPTTGAAAAGSFRALVAADIPQLVYSSLSGLPTLGSFAALSSLAFASLTGLPTTLSGYGITDAVNGATTRTANAVFAGPTTGAAAAPTFRALVAGDIPDISATYVAVSQRGANNGVATLDGGGKLTTSQIPASLVGAVVYQGTWNATTNTPTLASGTGTKGYYYKVATAGTTSIDGIASWNVGDTIIFDGTTWDKIDGITNEVITVAGLYGAITASGLKTALAISTSDVSGLGSLATLNSVNNSNWSGTALAATNGGTGLTAYTAGDLLYASATNTLAALAKGSDGNVLTMVSGAPAWAASTTWSALSGTAFGSYNLTIPALSANDTLATLGLAQTFTGVQTFSPTAVASPAALTWSPAASVVAGTSNTAGADFTLSQSLSTGTGVAGNGIRQAGFKGVTQSAVSVTCTSASPGVVTLTAHGFVPGQPFQFGGSAAPTGTSLNTTYYVIATGLAANAFQFSATAGGSAINTSSTGTSLTLTTGASTQNPASTIATWGPSGLTGSQTTSLLNLAQTWNTSGVPSAFKINVTDIASGSSALLMDLQKNGTSQFKVDKNGNGIFGGNVGIGTTSPGYPLEVDGTAYVNGGNIYQKNYSANIVNFSDVGAGGYLDWQSRVNNATKSSLRTVEGGSGVFVVYTDSGSGITERMRVSNSGNVGIGTSAPAGLLDIGGNVALNRDAANTLALRNGANAQTSRVYTTWTDASNGEWLEFGSSSSVPYVAATKNGSGTQRAINLQRVATPAGGSASAAVLLGTTASFGVYYGSGAPTVSAAQGSIYLRSDGSSTSTRLYVNTDGSTTWTNVTTAA